MGIKIQKNLFEVVNKFREETDDSEIIKLREQLEGYIQSLEKQNRKDQDGEK